MWIGLYRQIAAPFAVFPLPAYTLSMEVNGVFWGLAIVNWSAAIFTFWWSALDHGSLTGYARVMNVLLVGGSPRAKGNTDTLLMIMKSALEDEGLTATVAFLRDYAIHGCIGCEQCRTDKTCTRFLDGMHLLYSEIDRSVGLVLASPTYNYNITPMTKAFIDRMYPYFNFSEERPGPYSSRLAGRNRSAVTVGVCEQNEESEMGVTMPALTDPLRPLGYRISDSVAVTGHFHRGSVRSDDSARKRVAAAARQLARDLASHSAAE